MRFRPAALAAALVLATAALPVSPASAARIDPGTSPAINWAPVESATIYPGIGTEAAGAGCTANFVYTDRDQNVYIGQAAHCTSAEGSPLSGSGCASPSQPLGTRVSLGSSGASGELVYSSWLAMQKVGETDEITCLSNDFALIRIPAEAVAKVNPSVPLFGGPVGVIDNGGLPAGEPVYGYGASGLRGGIETPQQGFSLGTEPPGWYHLVYLLPPGVPGDSGGGLMDSRGRAAGVLISLNTLPPGTNGLTDLARALAYAQQHSGLKGLTLVPGTEAFTGGLVG
ncbi:hypothetical protein GCM10009547_21700 [Sporichthya brevicatena]|uniref:Serine protease n=1 Tax=Sporichthya brevicatena TaxID=171442 RepID=A0ABP3RX65_9ACTN